ncbi:hypothetical protein A3197_18000 [Candidatus Thiodiazotropha endoloripes]|nr:hypothetical protein A3197_18000 [Candidatus Thiodiazotropha endoloripes]
MRGRLFSGNKAYDAIEPIYSRLPDSEREEAENDFIRCAQLFADTSHEVSLLSNLKQVSSEGEYFIEQALNRAKHELAGVRDEGNRERAASSTDDEAERTLEDATTLSELVSASDGADLWGGRGVDYSYARRASKLVETASLEELLSFLDERSLVLNDAKFAINATSRLMDHGAQEKSDEIYALAEKLALAGNWSAWLGGEKIAFQKLRQKRAGVESQEEGFRSLVNDFSHGQASAQMVLSDLDEIIDIVAPNAAWDKVWDQVQDHLSVYREYVSTQSVAPLEDVLSPEDLIAYLQQRGMLLLSIVLTDRLRESLLEVARKPGGLKLFDIIASRLVQHESSHREIAAILLRLVENPEYKDVLVKHAIQLSVSSDAVVTNIARYILHTLGMDVEVPSEKLPAYYDLVVLGDENAEKFELPAGVEPGSSFWIEDPWYWTTSLGYEIKMVSDASGIEVEAIRRRCAEFMRISGAADAFGPPAEKRLEIEIKSLDLLFPYFR